MENDGFYNLKDVKNHKGAGRFSDVKGWKVFSSNGIDIGIVSEVMVNSEINREIHFDVFLHKDIRIKSRSRHLIVPLSLVSLDGEKGSLLLNDIKAITILRKTLRKSNPGKTNKQKDNIKEQETLKEKKLLKLKKNDSPISLNAPDIRGWSVITTDSITVGKVKDLFIDTELNSIQYFTVNIDEGPIFDKERQILVPSGLASLIMDDEKKIQIKININEFINYPPFTGEAVGKYKTALIKFLRNKNSHEGW